MNNIDVRFMVALTADGDKETRVYPLTEKAKAFYESVGYSYEPDTDYMPFTCIDDFRSIEGDFGEEATEQGLTWEVVRLV